MGAVDEEKLRSLVEFQIENGTDAIVPCGTTGEASTLDFDEHYRVIEIVVQQVNKRIPVIAGTGSNSTKEAIELTAHARKIGADGALLVTPYYNKPSQEGLYRHFKAVAEAVALPQVLYNVPGRTSVNLLPETVARLAEIPNIVAIKEATGSLQQASEVLALCGDKLDVLSGDDFITLPMMACGAKGVISVVANIMPKEVATLVDAFVAGKMEEARKLTPEAAEDRERHVHRNQSRAGQDRRCAHGNGRRRGKAAARANGGRQPGKARSHHERVWVNIKS